MRCVDCPVALTCEIANSVFRSNQESLRRQAGYLISAENSSNQSELYVALAVLDGEIAAEEAEKLSADIKSPMENGLGMSIGEHIASEKTRVLDELLEVGKTLELVGQVVGTMAVSCVECVGPKLNLASRFMETTRQLRAWNSRRSLPKPARDQFKEVDQKIAASRRSHLLQTKGKCSSTPVRREFDDLQPYIRRYVHPVM